MLFPSGAYTGSKKRRCPSVTGFKSPPSAETDQMAARLVSKPKKAMRFPSGDHAGELWPPGGCPLCVICRGSPPRDAIVQMVEGGRAPVTMLLLKSLSASD